MAKTVAKIATLLAAGACIAGAAGGAAAQTKITLGMSGWTGFAPLSLADKAGIFKKNGLDVELKMIPQKDRHLALASGAIQCAATTVETHVAWNANGVPIVQIFQMDKSYGADGIAVRNDVKGFSDLKGKTVVATTGSNTVMRLRGIDRKESLNLNLIQAKDFSDSMLTFTSGRADAFFEDYINLVGQISFSLNPADFALSTDTLSRDPYAVMLPRGEPEFKAVADKAIARLFASGEIKALYDKWFQSPIQPRGVNLHFPMSDALAKVIAKPTDSPNPSDY